MPSILNFVVKEALNTAGSHPPLDRKRCINARQGKVTCSACTEICPAGAMRLPEKGKADWDKCLSCGLCTAVCPSGALGFADYRQRRALQMLRDGHEVHVLGCQQAAGEMDSKAYCLSSFTWELIAMLALAGRVELISGDCEACPRREKAACLETALCRVKLFLGEARYEERIVRRGAGEAGRREVSRRELFTRFLPKAGKAKDGPDEAAERYGEDGQALRLMLAHAMEQLPDQEAKYGWEAPNFTQACWACGICAKICPNDALTMKEKDGAWRVVCSPVLCTGCGLCEAMCPDGGIDGLRAVRLPAGKRRIVHRTQAKVCPACGGAVKPDSGFDTCLRCRVTRKKKKVEPMK